MPVACIEHDHQIPKGEAVYGIAVGGGGAYTSFCEIALQAIPLDERFTEELPSGINIHSAMTNEDWNMGPVKVGTLYLGSRVFSISRRSLRLYLPNIAQLLLLE